MTKPRVFIGSSSEGLAIAESLFSCLEPSTAPTLWTHQLFLPGQYPLEALEKQLQRHSFAVIVASPDDEIVKRGVVSPSMRDNLLLEFGLFAGAFGRRRVFFVCPREPQLQLPSDLFGVLTATYDAGRVGSGPDERAAAVQSACNQIREVIGEEWERQQEHDDGLADRIRATTESKAIQRLHTVITRLRDATLVVQRDAFAAFSDRQAFDKVKLRAVAEVDEIAGIFEEDARIIEVLDELAQLHGATRKALQDLPFPQELSLGKEAGRRKAMDVGMQALGTFLGGGDPVRHVEDAAQQEAGGRLASLGERYSEWWSRHLLPLQEATAQLQDALFRALVRISNASIGEERSFYKPRS